MGLPTAAYYLLCEYISKMAIKLFQLFYFSRLILTLFVSEGPLFFQLILIAQSNEGKGVHQNAISNA